MRSSLIATLLVSASLILPDALAQPNEQDRKTFEATKANAEWGMPRLNAIWATATPRAGV